MGKRRVTVNLGVSGVAAHTKKITIQSQQAMIPLSWKTTFVDLYSFIWTFSLLKINILYCCIRKRAKAQRTVKSDMIF